VHQTAQQTEKAIRDLPQTVKRGWRDQLELAYINGRNLSFSVWWWIPPLLSLAPGLGQAMQHRYRTAAALAGSFLGIVILWLIGLRLPLADLLLWLAGAVVTFSVFDAANHSFPEATQRAGRLRNARMVLLSFCLVTGVLSITYWGLSQSYTLANLPEGNTNSHQFAPGDSLLIAHASPTQSVQRGDIIGLNIMDSENWRGAPNLAEWQAPLIGCVAAVAGDAVSTCGTSLCVNGKRIPARWLPRNWRGPISLPVRVPAEKVWVVRLAGQELRWFNELGNAPPVSDAQLVALVDIEGRATAIIGPPARRRWLRR
jgi:hypothetical protein